MNSDFETISFKSLTIIPGNLNFFIFDKFSLDFS